MSTAIITGGSRGFGLALVNDLARHGWTVITDGRDARALQRAVGHLERVHAVAGDVTDPAHRRHLVGVAADRGGLDLLVNNAGTLGPSPLPPLAAVHGGDLLEAYRINAVAPLELVQVALPLLRSSRGAVVNVTSDASVEAYEGWGAYGSSKAALDRLTAVLAAEEPDVRFWALDPGDMRTQMHQDAFPGEDISDRPPPEASAPAVRLLLAAAPGTVRVRAADLLAQAGAQAVPA